MNLLVPRVAARYGVLVLGWFLLLCPVSAAFAGPWPAGRPLSDDQNCDGARTSADLSATVLAVLEDPLPGCSASDLTCDGRLDDADLGALLATLFDPAPGASCPTRTATPPESSPTPMPSATSPPSPSPAPTAILPGRTLRNDGTGYAWNLNGDGSVSDGTDDAFDGGLRLLVAGVPVLSPGLTASGDTLATHPTTIAGLQVERRLFVSPSAGFIRYLEIFRNHGAVPVTVRVAIVTDLGSDAATTIVTTSTGDEVLAKDDSFIVTDDHDGAGDPVVALVFAGPTAVKRPLSVSTTAPGGDDVEVAYGVTVAPAGRVILMHFAAQTASRVAAVERAAALSTLREPALAGLARDERNDVVNFFAFADADGDRLPDEDEVMQGTDPELADSDGDGLLDGFEVKHGFDALLANTVGLDTDGDGLSDTDEQAAGSDPRVVDSDSDGLPDADEWRYETDASDPDSDADGLVDADELLVHRTDPRNDDSDGGGQSDGVEVAVDGSDPLDSGDDLLAVPPPAVLVDGRGFRWDVQLDGSIGNGSANAFDGALRLAIDGTPVGSAARLRRTANGRRVVIDYAPIGPLRVQRRIDVLAGTAYVRSLDVFENISSLPVSRSLLLTTLLGADALATRVAPDTGRSVFGFVAMDDFDGGGTPAVGLAFAGPRARLQPTRVSIGTPTLDHISTEFDMALRPRERVALLTFALQRHLAADAAADAAALVTPTEDALAGLSAADRILVANFFAQRDTDGDGLSDDAEAIADTSPNNPDTDADGLLDGFEVMHGFDPMLFDDAEGDEDGDGLTNRTEQELQTDPTDTDSDGDGLGDAAELMLGTGPNVDDTDDDGLSDGAENGVFHTNPARRDTDGGGRTDGEEIREDHTDALDPRDDRPRRVPLPYVLTDALGYRWDIHAFGIVGEGSQDAFDLEFEPIGGYEATVDASGRSLTFGGTTTRPGVRQWRRLDVPADRAFQRTLEILENTGGEAIEVTIGESINLGSDLATQIARTSSGDRHLDESDTWVVTDDADGGGDPTIAFLFGSSNARHLSDGATLEDGYLYHDAQVMLPPFGRAIVLRVLAQRPDRATAIRDLQELAGLGGGLLDGLSADERRDIVNFDAFPDRDADGLSDLDESAFGTDPNNPDTDGDGLTDGFEVDAGLRALVADDPHADSDDDGISDIDEQTAGTDGGRADSDDDGLADGEELQRGTAPLRSDTDGDGLTDGFEVNESGTDPLLQDSDDDAIDDRSEILAGFDPLSADGDPDRDGVSTAEELIFGSNPTRLDTDSDGLGDGSEQSTGLDPLDPDVGGTFFQAPVALGSKGLASTVGPRIATDRAGSWIAAWNQADPPGSPHRVVTSRSTDNGTSWSAPQPIDPGATRLQLGVQVAVDRSGNWLAAWYGAATSAGDVGSVGPMVSRSGDAGSTWSTPRPIDPRARGDFLTNECIRLAADGEGNWVMLWPDAISSSGQSFATAYSTDGGSSWTAPQRTDWGMIGSCPDLAADGTGAWVAVWRRPGESFQSVFSSTSYDKGTTWSPAVRFHSFNADAAWANASDPAIASDLAGTLVVAALASRRAVAYTSTDHGETWTTPPDEIEPFESSSTAYSIYPAITTDGLGKWVATWSRVSSAGSASASLAFARWQVGDRHWSRRAFIRSMHSRNLRAQLATDAAGNWISVWQAQSTEAGGDATEMLAASGAFCGDRVRDANETCDDGNLRPGDCCGAQCLQEPDGSACSFDAFSLPSSCLGGMCSRRTPPPTVTIPSVRYVTPTPTWTPVPADTDHDGLPDVEEERLGTDPNNPDSDGDNLSDGDEVRFGFDPLVPDADADDDGLSTPVELGLGTDPRNPDTDADGSTDGDEVRAALDPLDPSPASAFFDFPTAVSAMVPFAFSSAPKIATAGSGQWVAIWNEAGDAPPFGGNVSGSRSIDDGATWSPPKPIHREQGSIRVGSALAVSRSGRWVAGWRVLGSLEAPGEVPVGPMIVLSSDAGETWSDPISLDPLPIIRFDECIDVATDSLGKWMAVWNSAEGLSIATSVDDASTWSAPRRVDWGRVSNCPELIHDGMGKWIAVWALPPLPVEESGIALSTSSDDGVSWSPPSVTGGDEHAAATEGLSVAVDSSGRIVVAAANGVGIGAYSTADGGMTWSPRIPVTVTRPEHVHRDPVIATDGKDKWVVMWNRLDFPSQTRAVAFAISGDDARTFGATALARGGGPGFNGPDLATDGNGRWMATWRVGGNEHTVVAPGRLCGDLILDADESCDDGNRRAGDCCDDRCNLESDGASCSYRAMTEPSSCEAGVCKDRTPPATVTVPLTRRPTFTPTATMSPTPSREVTP